MNQWPRNETEILVDLYKNFPTLYAVKNVDNHNRNLKRNAFEELTKQLNSRLNKNFNVEEVKSKITKLRSQFIEISAKIEASKANGAGSDDVYKPSWFLYNRLQFIQPHIIHRKGKSNSSSQILNCSCHVQPESQDLDSAESQSKIEIDEFDVNDPLAILPEMTFSAESRSATQSPELFLKRHATPSTSSETPCRSTKQQKMTPSPATVPSNSDEDELFHFFNYIRTEAKKLNSEAQDYVKQVCFNSILEAKARFGNQH